MKEKSSVYMFVLFFAVTTDFAPKIRSSNLSVMLLKPLPTLTEHGGEGSTCDRTLRRRFLKCCSRDTSHEDLDGRRPLSAIDNQHLKPRVE